MSELADLLERFRRGPELIASVLTGAAGPEVDFRPAPDKWSVRQIVAHVSDSELVGAARFRRIVAEDNPTITGYDQNSWAERLNYAKRKPSAALETFRHVRAENYELLKDLAEEVFSRTGNHTERGTVTLLDLLRIYAHHAEKHAQQIRNVRDLYKQHKTCVQSPSH